MGRASALALALGFVACSGTIESGKSGGTGNGGSTDGSGAGGGSNTGSGGPVNNGSPGMGMNMPVPPVGPAAGCKTISPGPAPLRRLTKAEYDNTVRDLVGTDLKLAQSFPDEELADSFDNNAQIRSVSDVLAEDYSGAAETIAKTVVGKLGDVLPCDPAKDGEQACLDKFLDGFGMRLWRRPLEADERTSLKAAFTAGRAATFNDGIDAVVQVMVLSPQFMYRWEKGVPVQGADYGRLTHYEMANRLSYLIWGTMPDADLFTAAQAGKLGTRDEVTAQAKRMLDDPKATAMIVNFGGQWLQLRELADASKDNTVYPKWTDDYLGLFRQETESFIASVWKSDAKVDTMLSAPYTMVNAQLADFYGIKGVTGTDFQKVDVDATQRAGVVTHASIMAEKAGPDQSSPVYRGIFIREQMFCQPLPAPPDSVDAKPPLINATQTTKERFAAHRADPSCAGCHNLIDGVGFGFERYDATGAYRTMDNGKPVDSTGNLLGTDVDGAFDGAIELSKKMVASKSVETCLSSQWFNFGFGRDKTDADSCTVTNLNSAFEQSGGNFHELLMALVQTDAFFFKGGLQ